jgi:putative oxidoreductase
LDYPIMSRFPNTIFGGFNPASTIVDLLIGWPARIAAYFSWVGPLVARVVIGAVFLWSGWGKLSDLPTVIDNFVGWGIPFPKILAPFVAGVEFAGGILLLLGLFTRLAAVPLVIVMIVAIISAKWDEIDSLETVLEFDESAYLALFLWLAIAGPGPISLDHPLQCSVRKATSEKPTSPHSTDS